MYQKQDWSGMGRTAVFSQVIVRLCKVLRERVASENPNSLELHLVSPESLNGKVIPNHYHRAISRATSPAKSITAARNINIMSLTMANVQNLTPSPNIPNSPQATDHHGLELKTQDPLAG